MADNRAVAIAVADSVADGRAVDWDEVLRTASDERERGVIRQLRLVASLAEVHRRSADPSSEPTMDFTVTAVDDRPPAGERRTWAHLELRERLGAGAFGMVFRAWDPRLDREVALKLLIDTAGSHVDVSRAIEEGRLLAKLRHPNVVTVHGAEVHEGKVGVWMEYVRGRSLEEDLAERGPFGAQEAAMIGVDLCRALAAAHAAGVIHRDVKASNVMREQGGRILLTDFGAGVELREDDETRQKVSGTPLYMAPELFRGEPAGPRADLYSLGVLLFRLVTGTYPVEGKSWSELRSKHARHEAKLLRDVRPELPALFVQVVERATSHDPEDRYATAGKMEQALTAVLGAAPPSDAAPRTEPTPKSRWIAAAAVVLALVLGALAWNAWRERGASLSTYRVEAALYRTPAGSTKPQRIENGARLVLGDRVELEIEATAPLHVYVINEDDAGKAYALFPLPGFEPKNPLAPGTTHRLPGVWNGERKAWEVDTPGGRERLLVLASPERLVEFEAEMNALARPGVMAVEVSRQVLRGLGGLGAAPATASSESAAGLFDMAERLASGTETVRGVWLRRIELENPPPP